MREREATAARRRVSASLHPACVSVAAARPPCFFAPRGASQQSRERKTDHGEREGDEGEEGEEEGHLGRRGRGGVLREAGGCLEARRRGGGWSTSVEQGGGEGEEKRRSETAAEGGRLE